MILIKDIAVSQNTVADLNNLIPAADQLAESRCPV